MSTTYDNIYDLFLSSITDYELNELSVGDLETDLHKFLKKAISDFKYAESGLLDRDDVSKSFNNELTDLEQQILSKFMLVHWLSPHILRLENVRNELGNKDFRLYSPANFLEKITNLKKYLIHEAVDDMVFYYYST